MSAPVRPAPAPSVIAAAFGRRRATGQGVVLVKRRAGSAAAEDPLCDAVEAWAQELAEAAERELMEAATGGVLPILSQGA